MAEPDHFVDPAGVLLRKNGHNVFDARVNSKLLI